MKKVVISILLVLPFLLIFFISFTGQILSKYNYIPVERVALLDENGEEISMNIVKIGKNESYRLRVKIFPELASNKQYTITNSKPEICELDEETEEIRSKNAYGESTIIISSIDRHYVQYVLKVIVTEEDIGEIKIVQQSVTVAVGKTSAPLEIQILPTTTLFENRGLVFESSDESVATVDERTKTIFGKQVGTATITVRSDHRPEVFDSITVNVVTEQVISWNETAKVDQELNVEIDLFDLIKTIPENLKESVKFCIKSYYTESQLEVSLDESNFISPGRIKFKQANVSIIVEASVEYNGETYSEKIMLVSASE
jgi:hypothetical protein